MIQKIVNKARKQSRYITLLGLVALCALLLVPQSKFLHDNYWVSTTTTTGHSNDDNIIDTNDDDDDDGIRQQEQQQVQQLQGQRGRWIQDWEYARRTSYPNDGSYSNWHIAAQQFRPTPQQPFRLATSWYWHDEYRPLHLIDKAGFCTVSQSLNITRLLILGDSLSIQFHRSLLSLLGHGPRGRKASRFQAIFNPTDISCPNQQHNIIVKLERVSPLSDWLQLERKDHISKFVQENPNNTLVVANLGTWIQTMNDYQKGLHALLQWIDSVLPTTTTTTTTTTRVIPFFRPTIPGHPDCQPNQGNNQTTTAKNYNNDYNWSIPVEEVPWDSYVDFQVHFNHWNTINHNQTTKNITFQWDQFEEYNDYTKQQINMFSSSGAYHTTWHWLNVYNSTVLRRDGHIGFDDCLRKYSSEPKTLFCCFVVFRKD
jgi:hypothetical protein